MLTPRFRLSGKLFPGRRKTRLISPFSATALSLLSTPFYCKSTPAPAVRRSTAANDREVDFVDDVDFISSDEDGLSSSTLNMT